MLLAIKVFVLAAMIRLLIATSKPLLCAGVYAGCAFVLDAVFGQNFTRAAMMAGLSFVIAAVYFWILERLEMGSFVWWVVAVIGVLLVLL